MAEVDRDKDVMREIHLSVVIPVYGAPELITALCSRLHKSMREIIQDYEMILLLRQ